MRIIHGKGKPRFVNYVPRARVMVSEGISNGVILDASLPFDPTGCYIESYSNEGAFLSGKIIKSDGAVTLAVDKWQSGLDTVGRYPGTGKIATIYGQCYDLPTCENLIESFRKDSLELKMANGEIRIKDRGWYYGAVLDYAKYVSSETLTEIGRILNNTEKLVFLPRHDQPRLLYKVSIKSDYVLTMQQRAFHRGHRRIAIELTGTERLSKIDLSTALILPDIQVALNEGYGEDYGSID